MTRDEIRAFILRRPEQTAQALAAQLGLKPIQVAGYRASATKRQRSAPDRHLRSIRTIASDLRRLMLEATTLSERLDTMLRLFHQEFLITSMRHHGRRTAAWPTR
jgi:hypothetical protein